MTLPAYEKLGVFYLGRAVAADGTASGGDLLYDSRDLTTHAVCIGMTGSGKTGLCLSLLEEALLDGVPVLAIDPKGDLGNLLLTFPELSAADFAPWVDAGEAARKGISTEELAGQTAKRWRDGLAQWNEDGERIRRLREAAEFTIYTPGSRAGRPLSILRSLSAPAGGDESALKERIGAAVAGLLALLGIEADPIRSREHILVSALLDHAWRNGASLDLAGLIQAVQKPPFGKVGVFDLESFYAAKDRQELALRINALLAAPGFEAWLEGDALDAQGLLYTDAGKPRVSIVSIAHLDDAERMFVVTLIANELVSWMRRQPGTTSLRALFYMDEVFGYFPPTAMPPSKPPLLTLMKQARAFGLGVVLATQNPVDLDYKGLGNAGTWFIGRLQTERDKARVIDGLLGTDAATGLDRDALERELANLPQRRFLMRNAKDAAPVVFETRWALSYLRGPLTLAEITRLTPRTAPAPAPTASPSIAASTEPATAASASGTPSGTAISGGGKPLVPAGLAECYLVRNPGATLQPHVAARVQTHFVDAKTGVDTWTTSWYLAPLKGPVVDWTAAETQATAPPFASGPPHAAAYEDVPGSALAPKAQAAWSSQLADHVYRNAALEVFRCAPLKQTSAPGASESEFRAQLAQMQRERRDAAVAELRARFAKKLDALAERRRKAAQKLGKEQEEASRQNWDTVASVGNVIGGLLGAVIGGRRSATGRITSAVRSGARTAGRISKERADIERAEADAAAVDQQIEAVEAELDAEVAKLETQLAPDALQVERFVVKARKSDTAVDELALVWVG